MTSTICGSGQYFINEIFKIIRVDRLKKNLTSYIFVGDQDRDIKEILYNYETKQSLNSSQEKTLKEHFGIINFNLITKNKKTNLKFIYQRIYTDDTILAIRKKISCFISTQNDILLENNQELWVKMLNGNLKILGPTWSNMDIKPSRLSEDIQPDFKKFVSKNGQSILIDQLINNNDQVLFDATNGLKFEGNEIYLNIMEDDIAFLRSKGRIIDQLLLDGYFQKYWPYGSTEYDPAVKYREIERLKTLMKAEDRLINFVQNVPVNYDMFAGCRVIQILIHITNDYEHEFVDLLKIFNLFALDEKTPFKRYKDETWPAPNYHFFKPLVEKKIISEKQMKDWVSATKKVKDASDQVIKEIQYSVRGLTFKRYIYTLDGEPKYATINIHKNGNIEVRIAFKEKQMASMKDVYNSLIDIGKLINKINEIDYKTRTIKVPKSVRLNVPDVSYNPENNLLQFHGRTRLIMMDTINPVNIPDDFNYKEMNIFANKYFTPFVSPILSKRNYEENELLAKYKRVSFYSKMNLEYEFIHKTFQLNPGIARENVIALLHENYYAGRPLTEPIEVFKDWERKFGFYGSQGKVRQNGIEIRIKHGKIHLNGSKSSYQLTYASNFIAKFLNIFFNQSEILKKSQVKNIFSNELAKLGNFNNENINVSNTPQINYNYYNFSNTLGNIYGNEELISNIGTNITSNEEVNEEINSNNFNRENYLAKNDEIGKDVRMQCEERNLKKNVCVDFCEDEFYILRRLQRYDNPVFKFKKDPRSGFEQYSRKCSKDRQPLVLKNNPNENPKIDPRSFKNTVKYGSAPDRQNWYVCTQVWCPFEEIPIRLIKDKNDNKGKTKSTYAPPLYEKDIKPRKTRKGICLTAKCPSCLLQGRTTWLRIVENSEFHPYVGFIDESKHPSNLCMPCCFRKPTNTPKKKGYAQHMKCLGKDVENNQNEEGADYIMGRDKMPLTKGRYGLLPVNIANLFGSRCDTGKLPNNTQCHLRFGVKDDSKQSFLQAIVSVVEEEQLLNITIIKKYLFETKLTNNLFDSINNGELQIVFDLGKKEPIEHFKEYMMSDDQKITEEFLWDFLQRPGILEKNGLNIFILTSKSILCPVGFNAKEFFDPNRKSIILYTDGRYYEPIFFVKNDKGQLEKPVKIYEPDIPIIQKLYNMAINNCISKKLVDWEKIKMDVMGNKYYDVVPQLSARDILEKFKEPIKFQIKDKFNKIFAFLTEDGFILPFSPQGQLVSIDVTDKINPTDFKKTIAFYDRISKKYGLPYKPVRVFRHQDGNIIAIQLKDNSIIPVIPYKYGTDIIDATGRYYYNVNKYLAEGKENIDERAKVSLYIKFIQESYERLRLELARKLQVLTNERDKIINIIDNKEMPKKDKRDEMRKIIEKISRKIVIVLDSLPFPIENYIKPQLRRPCGTTKEKGKCLNNPHCYFIQGECKLIILNKSPVDGVKLFPFFIESITDELLRKKFLRDEILEDKLDEIIDKTVEVRNDEIAIYGAKDLIGQITEIYKPKKEYTLKNEVLFSKTEPNYKEINKNKYLSTSSELTLNTLNLQPLPSYWKQFFGPKVKYYDDKNKMDSLYYALLRALNEFMPQIKNIISLKNLQIQKTERLTIQNIDKEPIFKNMDKNSSNGVNRIIAIYKELNTNLYKNINTMTQLKEFILSDEYPANIVDIYILSEALGINIIVLEKRVKKSNPKGFYGFIYSLKKDYILLLEQQQNGKNIYSIIGKVGNYIFKKKDLPKILKEYFKIKNGNDE